MLSLNSIPIFIGLMLSIIPSTTTLDFSDRSYDKNVIVFEAKLRSFLEDNYSELLPVFIERFQEQFRNYNCKIIKTDDNVINVRGIDNFMIVNSAHRAAMIQLIHGECVIVGVISSYGIQTSSQYMDGSIRRVSFGEK